MLRIQKNSAAPAPLPDFVAGRFNTVLDDRAREQYLPMTNLLHGLLPEMMSRKIPRANVQQSFILSAVLALTPSLPRARVLCVGCHEDTAYEALRKMGFPVEGFDPNVDGRDLATFLAQNPAARGTYDTIFSTSVIEHVPDDDGFVRDIAALLKPGGVAILTCDYRDAWRPGEPLPPTDVRFYGSRDLRQRLLASMPGCQLVDQADWERFAPDFSYGGCLYGFATFTVRRTA